MKKWRRISLLNKKSMDHSSRVGYAELRSAYSSHQVRRCMSAAVACMPSNPPVSLSSVFLGSALKNFGVQTL
jgi:hypothetical protein